jgi:hypothetical protein
MRGSDWHKDVFVYSSEVSHHLEHLRDKLIVDVFILKGLIKFVHACCKHSKQGSLTWA